MIVLFVLVTWMGASTGPYRSIARGAASITRMSDRLKTLMDTQETLYGLKTGHSNDFESPPPPEFDGTAPSYYVPDAQTPLNEVPFPPLPVPDNEEYIAFCLVVRNQSIDMPEFFIHHYHHHGIRRFYIYDDGTFPPLAEKPYIDSWGIPEENIEFTYVPPEDVLNRGRLQADLYTDCATRSVGKHKWVAFLDPDEFLEMRGEKPQSLVGFLKDWEKDDQVGAVAVHWLNHNSDDVLNMQPGRVRKAFKKCIANEPDDPVEREEAAKMICGKGWNHNIKTFVRTDRFHAIENIHWVKTKNGYKEVTEHGDEVFTWCHFPVSQDKWALHHYMTKSREDWELKMGRHR